jgi:nitrite reductase (NO-forming)
VGETVRLFVGNGGPNLISSFHVIGEILDTVYTEGAIGNGTPAKNVQTTLIPAGGAAIVEMTMQVPGRFLLVDHSIVRAMEKGAIGVIEVSGDEQPGIFKVLTAGSGRDRRALDRAAPVATSEKAVHERAERRGAGIGELVSAPAPRACRVRRGRSGPAASPGPRRRPRRG